MPWGCFGMVASSKVPVKRYNLYVRDVFDCRIGERAVELDDDLPRPLLGRIKKLTEYAEKNPHRIPKISRRLKRRAFLYSKKNKVHLVHVVVRCFESMLRDLHPCPTSMMAYEIHQVIQMLIAGGSDERMNFQGLQLLFVFLRALHEASQWSALEVYFADVFRHALLPGRSPGGSGSDKKQKVALLCSGEVVRIIGETSHYFPQFELIVQITLQALDVGVVEKDCEEWKEDRRTLSDLMKLTVPEIAWGIFGRMEDLASNVFGATRVYRAMLRYFDEESAWGEGKLAFPCLRGVCARNVEGGQALVLTKILLQHLGSCTLPLEWKPKYVLMIQEMATKLALKRPLAVLILCIKEFAPHLPASEGEHSELGGFRMQILGIVESLAQCTGKEVSLVDGMASLLYTLPADQLECRNVLHCLERVAAVAVSRKTTESFPVTLFRALMQTYFSSTDETRVVCLNLWIECYRGYPSLEAAQWNLLSSTMWQVAMDEEAMPSTHEALCGLHKALVLREEDADALGSVTLAATFWRHALEPYANQSPFDVKSDLQLATLMAISVSMLYHVALLRGCVTRYEHEMLPVFQAFGSFEEASEGTNDRARMLLVPCRGADAGAKMRELATILPLDMPASFWELQRSVDKPCCHFLPLRPLVVKPRLRHALEEAATTCWSRDVDPTDLALPPAEEREHGAASSTEDDSEVTFVDSSMVPEEFLDSDPRLASFSVLVEDCSRSFCAYQDALRVALS